MKQLTWVVFAVAVAVPVLRVEAQTIYATGFEDPPFVAGQPLPGQDGWDVQIFAGNPLGPNGQISTAQPQSGSQSVAVEGTQLTPVEPLGYAVGVYRKFVDFDVAAAGFPVIRVAADLRIDGPQTTQTEDRVTGDLFSANLKAFSDDGGLGEFSLSSDGHAYVYTNDDSYLFGAPVALGQYHRLVLDLDFTNKTTTFSIDGVTLGSVAFTDGFESNVLSRGSLLVYGLDPDPLSRDLSAYTAYFDNFSITAVPEPSTLALSGIGIGSLLALRTIRRARRRDSSSSPAAR